VISPLFFIMFYLISIYLFSFQQYESSIKIPGFRQNFQKYKKIRKEKKYFCADDQVS
jgi:hypothetical protein